MTDLTAAFVRSLALSYGERVVDKFMKLALGDETDFKGDTAMLETAFKALIPQMKVSDDVMKLATDKVKHEVAQEITNMMCRGEITASQCRAAVASVKEAANITEIRAIQERVEELFCILGKARATRTG